MNGKRQPAAPSELDAVGKALWRHIHQHWDMNASDGPLVRGLCIAYSRAGNAAETLKREGAVVVDRFGQQKEHPAVGVEQKAWQTVVRLWRELALSDEPPPTHAKQPRGYR